MCSLPTSSAVGNLWYFFSSSSSELSVSSKFSRVWSFCCKNLKNSGSLFFNRDSCSLCSEALPFFFASLKKWNKHMQLPLDIYFILLSHRWLSVTRIIVQFQNTHMTAEADLSFFLLIFLLSPFCLGASSWQPSSPSESMSPDWRNSSNERSSSFLAKVTGQWNTHKEE